MANKELIEAVNVNATAVKESIYNTFNGHSKTIRGREQWLIDQVDSIRLAAIQSIHDKTISSENRKAKVQQCEQILMHLEENEAIKVVEMQLEDLKLQQDASGLPQNEVTEMKFEHDKFALQKQIESYGNIKSSEFDEKESISCSEESWDCCKSVKFSEFDIEDMDVTAMLGDQEKETLVKCCQANEVCARMDECLFEENCCKKRSSHVDNLKKYFQELNINAALLTSANFAPQYDFGKIELAEYQESESQSDYVSVIRNAFHTLILSTAEPEENNKALEVESNPLTTHTSDVAAAFGKLLLSDSIGEIFEKNSTPARHQETYVNEINASFNFLMERDDKSKPLHEVSSISSVTLDPLRLVSPYILPQTKTPFVCDHEDGFYSQMDETKLQLVSSKAEAEDLIYASEKQDLCKDNHSSYVDSLTSVFATLNDAY